MTPMDEATAKRFGDAIYLQGVLAAQLGLAPDASAKEVLAATQTELRNNAALRADNDALRKLWTDARVVMAQSRAANCVCAYGAIQADAVEAVNKWMNTMPDDPVLRAAHGKAQP